MKTINYILVMLLFVRGSLYAQDAKALHDLPLHEFIIHKQSQKPLVIYLCGDGGYNNFSKELILQWNNNGYNVIMLNSYKYFWKKKTPLQSATALQSIIQGYPAYAKNQVLLCGFSFGADVLPFIYNKLNIEVQKQVSSLAIIAPSPTTGLEIKLSGMWGKPSSKGMNVADEINSLNSKPVVIVFPTKEEGNIDPADIKLPNIRKVIIKGDHRFDGKIKELIKKILSS